MIIDNKKFHIAAVSLIEIMMIFTIIGIVTSACVSLNKPKNEYMKKIKLYSAFTTLEAAGKIIAKEGHIDFTVDAKACLIRNESTLICQDYLGAGNMASMFNNYLPEVANRPTEAGYENISIYDPGLAGTEFYTFPNKKKRQILYLQSGLCQRLSKVMNIPETGLNCVNASNFSGTDTPDFQALVPHLFLPNGMVLYITEFALSDYRGYGETISIKPYHDTNIYIDAYAIEASLFKIEELDSIYDSLPLVGISSPYESVKAALLNYEEILSDWGGESFKEERISRNEYKAFKEITLRKNTDYFKIYVDINGKMSDANDKPKGPDKLNVDIFPFKMYRDGTVMPDYDEGFPQNYITAKLLYRDPVDLKYKYEKSAYANKPVGFSRCYANLTRVYSTYSATDMTGVCTYAGTTIPPLNKCLDAQNNPICKSIVNKPSFFVR